MFTKDAHTSTIISDATCVDYTQFSPVGNDTLFEPSDYPFLAEDLDSSDRYRRILEGDMWRTMPSNGQTE
jgi:hypothetical protein